MDNDLRPFRPGGANTEAKQAPLTEPTPPKPMEDPFKADPAPVTSGKVKRGGKGKKVLLFLLILILLGGVGYGVYYWQHQQVDTLAKQNQGLTAEVAALKTEVVNLKEESAAEAEVVVPTADELVMASAKVACEATIDPTSKKALVYTQGTSGADKKKVLYSADKTFATTSAVCATSATSTDPAKVFYLKKVGEAWVVLYSGTTADAAMTTKYGIPAVFN